MLTVAAIVSWAASVFVLDESLLGAAAGGALLLTSHGLTVFAVLRKRAPDSPQRMVQEAERGRRLAIYDPSSGVLAQWYFELRLLEETLRAKRYGLPMVVLTVDGSSAATDDEVGAFGGGRKEASLIAANLVRGTDFVGSIGFSGFAVCLIHCDRKHAVPVIRRLMEGLGEGAWRIGMAVYPDDECEGKELIEVATRRSAPWRVRQRGGETAA